MWWTSSKKTSYQNDFNHLNRPLWKPLHCLHTPLNNNYHYFSFVRSQSTSGGGMGDCSFGVLVAKPVQLFMFCAVYGPSALVLLVCYGYIYIVARGHARAIRSEGRHSFSHSPSVSSGPSAPRYGLALAITTGMFLGLWLPFQVGIENSCINVINP